jgi:cell division protease FtsH
MGGRIAEELIFGADKVTTGASSDIKMATDMSRRMVMEWGMSDLLGPINYGSSSEEVFLGYSMGNKNALSGETAAKVENEIRSFVENAYARAKETLTTNLHELHALAQGLLEYETLSGDEIPLVLKGEKLHRDTSDTDSTSHRNRGKSGSVPTAGGVDLGSPEPRGV